MANMNNKKLILNGDSLPPLPLINPDGTWGTEKKVIVSDSIPIEGENLDIENQIAKNYVEQTLNKRTPEEEELKKQTISSLMRNLQKPVEVQKRLNISDILKGGNFADRLETFAQYAQQPEFERNLGNIMGTRLFNRQTGRFENTGDRMNREAEIRLRANQQQALEQQKIQDLLAGNVFGDLAKFELADLMDRRERDLAGQNLLYKQQQADEARAQQEFLNNLAMLKFDEDKRHNIATEENQANKKVNTKVQNAILQNQKALKQIDTLIEEIAKPENAGTTGFWQGMFADNPHESVNKILNENSNENQIYTRGLVSDLRSMTIHDRAGTAQTLNEMRNLRGFLPSNFDSPKTMIAKLKSMRKTIENESKLYAQTEGVNINDVFGSSNTLNDDYVNMKAPNGKIYKVPKEKVNEMERKGGEII